MPTSGKSSRKVTCKAILTPPVLAVLVVVLCSLPVWFYGEWKWHTSHARFLPAIVNLENSRLDFVLGHLWLEELLSGDKGISKDLVWQHLDNSSHHLNKALLGQSPLPGIDGLPLDDPEIKKQLNDIQTGLARFKKFARKRQQNNELSKTGSVLDQDFDLVFKGLLAKMDTLQANLNKSFADSLQYRERMHLFIAGLWGVFLLLSVAALLHSAIKSQKAKETLQLSEEKFSAAFDASPVWVVLSSKENGRYLDVNQTFLRDTGYSKEEVLGRTSLELGVWADRKDRDKVIELIKRDGRVQGLEVVRRTKDGRDIAMLFSAEPFALSGKEYLISVSLDISQRKKAEDENIHLEAQLRQSQKMEAIGTLASGIAHDFNNILTAILGYTELALDQANEGEPNRKELNQVLVAAMRARDLVQKILTFSRKVEPNLGPINLNRVVKESVSMLRHTLPKMIDIKVYLSQELNPINADSGQLGQVLMNLGTNAKDAMPQGGELVIETQDVVLDSEYSQDHLEVKPGHYVMLIISDNGQGMDAETRAQIFDPFFTTKGVGQGTGLGLSTVFGIVKNHGGQIYCYSEPGKGTTFKVYFPALKSGWESDEPEVVGLYANRKGRERILLVDDEPSLLDMGKLLLTRQGYQVITARSGEETLEIFKQDGKIDLIILDVGMPGMGGQRCLAELLKLDPNQLVIISSGYSLNGQLKEMMDSGLSGFVAKPFRQEELLSTVRSVLDQAV